MSHRGINIPSARSPNRGGEGRSSNFASSCPGSPSVSLEAMNRRSNRMYKRPLAHSRWQPDSPNCLQCGTDFGWWPWSRHHCRYCGQMVCGACSKKRVRYGREELRVCGRCFRDGCQQGAFMAISLDVARALGDDGGELEEEVRRSPGVLDRMLGRPGRHAEMEYCPGCSAPKPDASHIRVCLERESGRVVGDRLVIMPAEEAAPTEECLICYDPLSHPVALLNCFCKYHKRCIESWFTRNPSCPLHPSSTT